VVGLGAASFALGVMVVRRGGEVREGGAVGVVVVVVVSRWKNGRISDNE